jgi:hypothetical protein
MGVALTTPGELSSQPQGLTLLFRIAADTVPICSFAMSVAIFLSAKGGLELPAQCCF